MQALQYWLQRRPDSKGGIRAIDERYRKALANTSTSGTSRLRCVLGRRCMVRRSGGRRSETQGSNPPAADRKATPLRYVPSRGVRPLRRCGRLSRPRLGSSAETVLASIILPFAATFLFRWLVSHNMHSPRPAAARCSLNSRRNPRWLCAVVVFTLCLRERGERIGDSLVRMGPPTRCLQHGTALTCPQHG